MRRLLDWLYLLCGGLAAFFLVAIGVLVLAAMIMRWTGTYVPGLDEYAGYSMAASSFLALAYTFGHGGHIRVNLLLVPLRGRKRRIAELWCLGAGGFFAAYFAWYSVKMVIVSYQLDFVSEGTDASPLWIPQLGMAAGTAVLALCMIDRFVQVARGAPTDTAPELTE